MSRNGSLTDDDDQAFAEAVELAQERAKVLYLHKAQEVALRQLSHAFDEGFQAAMEFCASDEFQAGASPRNPGQGRA